MPDLALQLRVSKNALRSPAFQEEIVSQVLPAASLCLCTAASLVLTAHIAEVIAGVGQRG